MQVQNDRILAEADDAAPSDAASPSTVGTVGVEGGLDGRSGRAMSAVPAREIVNHWG